MAAPKGHPPYNKKGEGGRPKEWTAERIEELAEDLEAWLEKAHRDKASFWWHDWCWDHGIQPSKITELANENKRFLEVYRKVKEWQESIVVKGALTKKLSDGFTKFYLCNHYSKNWKNKDLEDQSINHHITITDARHNSPSQVPLSPLPGPSLDSN